MAHVQARRRKPITIPGSVQKENRNPLRAPPTSKKTVSINGIFDHVKGPRKAHEVRSVLSPRPAGIPKAKATPGYFTGKGANLLKGKVAQPGFFAKYRANGDKTPSGLPFSDPVADYHKTANANFERRMEQWRKELGLRRDGLDVNGKPMRKAPVPTEADIDAVAKELEELQKPIEDDVLHIQDPQTGNATKTRKLGETLEMLDRRLEKKFSQIQQLEIEQKRLDDEVEILKKQVLGDDKDYKKAKDGYEAQLTLLQKEVEKVEAQAKSELEEMKRKDRNAKKAFNLKIQALWEGINDYE
ncbi:hypothetical protein M409DRAFT_22930 [Zasmidium cellare ATCC 36951]|uniref:Uncharacterized protein n=1 Tax=Zasmidium cellare ATCC 36951 TaxID=1080233 RepID=A0A6A6CHY9_ZASCE|nr:uncharacterized protein M409DRAFT_22930 [Zasmidium cellare ATCC 36951]KAF2166877.1 hypothetical protein M409DRAFT_22930 [Zasmidium cellare ATCC 36951]